MSHRRVSVRYPRLRIAGGTTLPKPEASSAPAGIADSLAGDMFSSLRVADYSRLFFGNMGFQFNNWMQQLTFGWLLLLIGNSPFWLGLNGAMAGIAMTVMSPIGGAVADAWERRRSLLVTQTTAVTINGGIALLFWLDKLEIWHLLLASLLMGMSYTFNMPARQSLMAEIVPKPLLHNATALHTASMNLARITGPGLAGFLLATIGPLAVLLVNLVANGWTVSQILSIKHRPATPPRPFRLRGKEIADGFRFCWATRRLFETLLIVSASNLFGMSFVQLLPAFARDSLGTGPDGLGILTSSMGGGALAGALLLARIGAITHKRQVIKAAAMVGCLLLVPLGLSTSVLMAATVLAIIGALSAVITALGLATVQQYVPNELSGRVFGVYMLCMGLMPLGSLPSGTLADSIGTAHAIAIWGIVGAVVLGGIVTSQWFADQRTQVHSEPAVADARPT